MSDSNAHESRNSEQPPDEPVSPVEATPDLPSARYRATLRLIRSRLVDESRSRAKPWWKRKG